MRRRNQAIAIGAFVGSVAALGLLSMVLPESRGLAAVHDWTAEAGAWAPLAFVVGFAVAVALFVPGSLLTIAGGVLFGPAWGFLWSWLGMMVGVHIAYAVGRAGGGPLRPWLKRRLPDAMDAVEEGPFMAVLILQAAVFVPSILVGYASGLAKVPVRSYTPACAIGFVPGTLVFVLAGGAFSAMEPGSVAFWAVLVGATAVLLALAYGVQRAVRGRSLPFVGDA